MIITDKIGKFTEIYSNSKYLHKVGTQIYLKPNQKTAMLPTDTLDMYIEVAEMPKYTKEEYDAKVNELVRTKYSESEEFAIQRKMLYLQTQPSTLNDDKADAIVAEFDEYNAFVEECKVKTKEELDK